MKKIFIPLILFATLVSFLSPEKKIQERNSTKYLIKKIESKHNWYFIYAFRNDTTFKIISKKEQGIIQLGWEKVVVGNYFNFELNSIIPVINGVKMMPINYLDFLGISLDDKTIVNIDPSKGIYDLYSAKGLKGLYLTK